MNSNELKEYRKRFYKNLESFISLNDKLTVDDLQKLYLDTILQTQMNSETSKKVLVYMGTYVKDSKDNTKYNLTYDGNLDASCKIYFDIETKKSYCISLKQVHQFEKERKIIFPDVEIFNVQEYNKKFNEIRLDYFKKLLYNSQKESYKLIKTINEEKYYL